MPKKAPTKSPTKSSGKGLKKKLGPFPVYVYLIGIVAIVGYIIYKKRQSGTSSTAGSLNQQVIPIAVPSGGQSGAASTQGTTQGTTQGFSDTASTPIDFPSDYVTSTDFQSGLDTLGNQIGASIAQITFPPPSVNITVPPATVIQQTVKSKTAAKKAAVKTTAQKPTKYYTYKKNVPLKAGQKLHFTKGKGYYAA